MTWLTTREVADLIGKDKRTIERNYLEYKYRHVNGKGRGGQQLRIALESLDQPDQDRYNGIIKEKQANVYMSLTQAQRDIVDFKHCRVIEYKRFKESYPKADKMQAFLQQYNEQHSDNPLTKRQINHWETLFDREGINGLVDRRGGYNKDTTTIPENVWEVFKKLWLKESRPTAQSCYDMTVEYFPEMELPHISAFLRQIDKIPKPVVIRYREGEKAFQDKCEPYIPQDYSAAYSNEQWIADHHVFDVLVVDENENVFRPWLSGWQDNYSKMIVGYAINKVDPNSDIVLDSFARANIKHGIPESVKLDNGKDYKTYDLFNTDFPMSVCNEMYIKVSYANPYNAKAKPIERTFGTVEGRYCKHLPSYIGNDPKKRPEKMKKLNTQLVNIAMPYGEFKEFVDNMIKTMNTTPHSALNGKTPLEKYKNGFVHAMRVVANQDILNMFLMRTTKPLTVGRNGINVSAIGYYYNDDDKLTHHQGEKVYARYNSDDIRQVYIFSEEREFICMASSVELSQHFSPVTMEHIRELQRKKKALKKFVKEQMPNVSVPTIQEFVSKKANRYEDINLEKDTILVNPIMNKHAKAIAKAQEENTLDEQPLQEVSTKRVVNGIDEKQLNTAMFQLFKGR